MRLSEKIINEMKAVVPEVCSGLGGVPETPRKKMSARLSVDEQLDHRDVVDGVYDAMIHLMGAELFIGMLDNVYEGVEDQGASFTHDLMWLPQMGQFATQLQDLAKATPSSIIITTVMHLTILQAVADSPYVRDPTIENVYGGVSGVNPIKRVGMLGETPVFVNPYASANNPSLVCQPGWFTYASGKGFSVHGTKELLDGEKIVEFDTDYEFLPIMERIRSVTIDPDTISFHLYK